jgi:flagellar motor switch protein FliN/FliY
MSLSQEEIDALLAGGGSADAAPDGSLTDEADEESVTPAPRALSGDEIDILGEVGNICMGAVATTMYTLLSKPVSITTPRVSVHTNREILDSYEIPYVAVQVEYTEGIKGKNLMILRQEDAALITDLLMGGDGLVQPPIQLDEMHLSAINEIMNQMMGASATSMAKLLNTTVNISTPVSRNFDAKVDDVGELLDRPEIVIKISFNMEIEGLLDSELLQLIPYDLGIELATRLKESGLGAKANGGDGEIPDSFLTTQEQITERQIEQGFSEKTVSSSAAPVSPAAAMPAYAQPQPAPPVPGALVDVHPMQYQSFDTNAPSDPAERRGIDMIQDIPLSVTVELGKTKRQISEILKFGVGTLIVLDKTAGDPVEVIVNGKLIARGEVVVIDDSYGVRITELCGG